MPENYSSQISVSSVVSGNSEFKKNNQTFSMSASASANASASATSSISFNHSLDIAIKQAAELSAKIANEELNKNLQNTLNTYDYIVVGAGAGGSVVAARLAEDLNIRVLLLEHGHDNTQTSTVISEYDKVLINTPAFFPYLYQRYHGSGSDIEACPTKSDFSTTFQNNSRFYSYPRGNGGGGSTNHHAMVDGRGTPYVYDSIAQLVKDPVWSYENILPYYKKMESYNVDNNNPEIHGYDGWLSIRNSGPMDEDLRQEIADELKRIYDVPFNTDPAVPSQVVGLAIGQEQADKNGNRSNAFTNLVKPMLDKQANLTVKFNSLVEKVLISNDVAYGVTVYDKGYLCEYNITGNKVDKNGNAILPNKELPSSISYYATKEVILCAGAITTPQILMLSGIGPKEHLNNLGINIVKDLQGVGQNLMDHIESTMTFELDPEKIIWGWQAKYMKEFTDYKNLASPKVIKNIEKYYKSNAFETNALALMWDWYSVSNNPNVNPEDPSIINPDSHTHIFNAFFFDFNLDFTKYPNGDNYNVLQHQNDELLPVNIKKSYLFNNQINPANPIVLLSFLSECLQTKATGKITLHNKDPRTSPIIDLALFTDEKAVNINANALMKIRNFFKNSTLRQWAKNPDDYDSIELYPGKEYKTVDDLKNYIKNWQSYGHHISGTAKMGPTNDDSAVLDSRLRVKGIKGLRVVDASIYPTPFLHGYNPSRGIYMMAEVASDFIKKEYLV
jgi:choline dehydrogenase